MKPKSKETRNSNGKDVPIFYSPIDSDIQVIMIKIPCEYYRKL